MRKHPLFAASAAALALFGAVLTPSPAAAQQGTATPAPQLPPAPQAPPGAYVDPTQAPGAPVPYPGWPPQPTRRAPPQSAIAPNGEYYAPLSQTTQPVYIPQSVALSGPRMIKDWHDGDQIPYGYHREERTRKGEIISGSILFGVTWGYSAFFGALGQDVSPSDNKLGWLFVPVIGPFIEMTQYDSSTFRYVMVLDGVAQGVGAALLYHGATSPRPILVRDDLALLTVAPARFGKDGNGLALVGRF
jgi:hypothetical protein